VSSPGESSGSLEHGKVYLGLRFLGLVIVCLTLMFADHQKDHLSLVRQALGVVIYPVRALVDLPFKTWNWASSNLETRSAMLAENQRLNSALLNASVRLQQLATLEAENIRLRAILDSSARVRERVLIAEILSVDLNPYRQRFIINRGTNSGVYVGQALLDADGVVGQIVRADPFSAEVVLISDADHSVPVSVIRNGLRTFAVGTGDSKRLRLPYLTNSADIQVDDLLVSSGLGGVFPSGYPVARVLQVVLQPGQFFAEVFAEPVSELDHDREVMLVWTTEDSQEATNLAAEVQ